MYHAPKGMNDILPHRPEGFLQSHIWHRLQQACHTIFERYHYQQVWLPVVEELSLFVRGLGESTDIVSKEMYTFLDRGERQLALRPEGTAGAARAYLEHGSYKIDPIQKWWYTGPMYRAERPQKGRYRQFYQIGAEAFGVASPASDVELISMAWHLCQHLQLTNLQLRLNSLGDTACRERYRQALRELFAPQVEKLCTACQQRLQQNPLRMLDCKKSSCQQLLQTAPDIRSFLSGPDETWLMQVETMLAELGIPVVRDSRLVRGLDYYNGIIFEFVTTALGAQDAILGGGRYDNLLTTMGGPEIPAVGFAAGVERLALLLVQQQSHRLSQPDLYLVPLNQEDILPCLLLVQALRQQLAARIELHGPLVQGKPKSALRRADKLGAHTVLVLGEQERQTGRAQLKHLASSSSLEVPLTAVGIGAGLQKVLIQQP